MKITILSLILSFTLLALGCKPDIEQGLSHNEYINKAEQAITASDLEKAISYYKMALKLQPNDANSHYILGELYKREYRTSYNEAWKKRFLHEARRPALMKTHYDDKAEDLKAYGLKVGYDELGIQEFKEAVKYNNNHWLARHWIAVDYFEKKQYYETIQELKKVIELNPQFEGAYSVIGEAYMEIGSLDLALTNLEIALKLDPAPEYIYYKLGLLYRKMNNGDKLNEMLQKLKSMQSIWYDELRLSLYR
ncbi:MAG: tetratricopeptide repeat protein [Phycisphaerae bacterium]|nr:tetratricopeptide repeat protein [Phycisphaerae bacterium]